jgi:hypothetical protein
MSWASGCSSDAPHESVGPEVDAYPSRERDRGMSSPRVTSFVVHAVTLIVVGALGLWVVSALTGLPTSCPKPQPQRPFNSATWKLAETGPETRDADRGRMIDSLLRDHQLVGMTQERVQEMLGPPDSPPGSGGFPDPAYRVTNRAAKLDEVHGYLILVYDERKVVVGWWTPWDSAGASPRRRR